MNCGFYIFDNIIDIRRKMRSRAVAVTITLAAIYLPLVLSLYLNQGHFVYTLDDPYIHLALADNISHGHYGINEGENTAPSSSVLWPLLLVPFAGFNHFYLVPLVLNVLFAALTALLLAGYFRWENLPFTLAALFGFNLAGLVLTGMEHSLQVLLVTAATVMLVEFAGNGKLRTLLFPVLTLLPLVRYECMAVSLPSFIFLFLSGKRKKSLLWFSLSLLLTGGFSLYLVSLGLNPLPASVMAKSSVVSGTSGPFINMISSLGTFRGMAQFLLFILLLVCVFRERGRRRLLAGTAALSVLMHLSAGRFGWFHRYGVYMWVWSALLCFELCSIRLSRFKAWVLILFLLLSGNYLSGYTKIALASSNIYRQQFQMRRFVHNILNEPVAVNDLGLVCFGYDHYVLDLWGLATPEALEGSLDPLWVDSAAAASGVDFAIVYRDELPGIQHWTQVASMELDPPLVVCAQGGVDFLAAPWADPDRLFNLLCDFNCFLPEGIDLICYRYSSQWKK